MTAYICSCGALVDNDTNSCPNGCNAVVYVGNVYLPKVPCPQDLPRCRHGNAIMRCSQCAADDKEARARTAEFVRRFWDHHGRNSGDLENLMASAFRAGREFERALFEKKEEEK